MENVVTIDGKRYELRVAVGNEVSCALCAFKCNPVSCVWKGNPLTPRCVREAMVFGTNTRRTYFVRIED